MSTLFGHQILKSRYSFQGKLKVVTPLRISSGRASDETDAPFMRNYAGTIYIPGSSLRGAIRSELERILVSVGQSVSGLKSCILFEKDSCAEKFRQFHRSLQNDVNKKPEDKGKSDDQIIVEYAREQLCDVCLLFGSTEYASKLVFEDCHPINPGKNGIRCCIRDGVGIDRDTGSAREGAKFDYEVVEPSAEGPFFRFRMVAENIGDPDKKLINLTLALLKAGLYVGGKRAGGLGKIMLVKESGKYVDVTGFQKPEELWKALTGGTEVDQPINWKEDI